MTKLQFYVPSSTAERHFYVQTRCEPKKNNQRNRAIEPTVRRIVAANETGETTLSHKEIQSRRKIKGVEETDGGDVYIYIRVAGEEKRKRGFADSICALGGVSRILKISESPPGRLCVCVTHTHTRTFVVRPIVVWRAKKQFPPDGYAEYVHHSSYFPLGRSEVSHAVVLPRPE